MTLHPAYPSPKQPITIKAANRVGRGLRAIGFNKPRFVGAELMATAVENSGLEDYGDLYFTEALEALIGSIEREARLSQIGRIAIRAALVGELEKRLKLIEYRKQNPRVAQQTVTRPLIVAGLPRTGTTILYELLAQDPQHRAPASWEVAMPFPPALQDSYLDDPRVEQVESQLSQLAQLAPEFKAIHAVGANLPQECVSMLASTFNSDLWAIQFYCPTYRSWCLQQDMTPNYLWHYHFLQHLQSDFAKPRWLLKSPSHIAHLQTLFAQYRDAALIQTHREPTDIMGSVSSLACTLHSAYSDDIDPAKVAAEEVRYFAQLINRGMEQRDALADAEQRFFDVRFKDLISQPLQVIGAIYRHFDFEFSDEAQHRMQRYLDERPRDKHGSHSYTLDRFGLDKARDGTLFDEYRERYCRD